MRLQHGDSSTLVRVCAGESLGRVRMNANSQRFQKFAESPHPWEAEAVHFLREALADVEPNRIWALFEFISRTGTVGEVDALVLTAKGLFLVEIKSRPGSVTGDAGTWTWTHEGRRTTDDNPVILANRKCKRLADLLRTQRALQGQPFPFLQPLIFLSHESNTVDVDAGSSRSVCTRKGGPNTQSLLHALTQLDPEAASRRIRIDAPMARAIQNAMAQAGIRQSTREKRFGSAHQLDKLLLEGASYQDWLAHHLSTERVQRRIRIYPAARAMDVESRKMFMRAARREFEALNSIQHEGVLRALHFEEGEQGPGLVFEHHPAQVRLDHFIHAEGDKLNFSERLQILRQIAEAIRHAHDRRLVHRALSPQSVLIRRREGGGFVTHVYNWQTASRESGATGGTLHATQHIDDLVDPAAVAYLAPETQNDPTLRAEHLDLFGLGGIAFLLFAGRAPADSRSTLIERLRQEDGLLLSASVDNVATSLVDLVRNSTRPKVPDRYGSVAEFLRQLDEVENELTRPDDEVHSEPTEAKVGQRFPGGWVVRNRLGQGSTAVVFLVEREASNGKTEERVLKLALNPDKNASIADEGEVLSALHHEGIVRFDGRLECAGHEGLLLARAGDEALSSRLRKGALPTEQLQRFGEDLLAAIRYLESEAVFHRDIKPDNLGIAKRGRGDLLHLVLFDFSLARAPLGQTGVGTRAYMDPFLGQGSRRQYDSAAERFSVAMTLYEMATGRLPRWGDGISSPALTGDEVDLRDESLFAAELREPMTAFFRRALASDAKQRFDNVEDMKNAWDAVFEEPVHAAPPQDAPAPVALTTPLQLLGVSTRAINVLERHSIETVRQLLEVPQGRLTKGRGVGTRTREELLRLLADLRARFPGIEPKAGDDSEAQASPEAAEAPAPMLGAVPPLNQLVDLLLPKPAGKGKAKTDARLLGDLVSPTEGDARDLPWPTQSDVARKHDTTAVEVSLALKRARDRWRSVSGLTVIRDAFLASLVTQGGIATIDEGVRWLSEAFGEGLQDPVRRDAARAVLRAALEAEVADRDRFTMARRSDRVFLLAKESESGEPIDDEALLRFAVELGRKAQQLAESEPLPAPALVMSRLAGVAVPAGIPPIAPERLVRLAAGAGSVAVSGNLGLYPRGMPAERALKLAHTALLGSAILSPDQIRERIRSRYPEAEALPTDPTRLQSLLKSSVPDLKWDGEQRVFRFQSEGGPLLTGHVTLPARRTTDRLPAPDDPERVEAFAFDRRLERARESFLVLTTLREQHETVLRRLLARFPDDLVVVSCESLFLRRLQQTAQEKRIDWQRILLADEAGASPTDSRNLRQLVELAAGQLGDDIGRDAGLNRTVLLTRMGLLARFDLVTKVVSRLRERAKSRPDSEGALRGIWLLVATPDDAAAPKLDGKAIPVPEGLTDYARVPVGWIQGLLQERAS